MQHQYVAIHDRAHGLFGFASHPVVAVHLLKHLGEGHDAELGNIVARAEAVNRRAHAHTLAKARVALSAFEGISVAFFKVLLLNHLMRRLYYHPHGDFALIICRDGHCQRVDADPNEDLVALDMDPHDRAALVHREGWQGIDVGEQARLLQESPDDAIASEWIRKAMPMHHSQALVFDVPSWSATGVTAPRSAPSTTSHTERWQHELRELDKDLHDLQRRFKKHKQRCGPSATSDDLERQIKQVHSEILRREWWVAHEAGDHRTMAIKQRAFEAL